MSTYLLMFPLVITHTLQDLSNLDISEKDFSLFHMIARSLSLHLDEVLSTLATLQINFDVIGVSETWNSFEISIKTNVEIPGYNHFPHQSHSQNGGVALIIKSRYSSTLRLDLSKDNAEFEAVWVEIDNKKGRNYLLCFAYRHPDTNLESYNVYLQETLSNSAVYNKQVLIPSDFIINLLNYNSHTLTTNFVNCLFCNHFLPHIIHPCKVSDYSSTLIDNIFANIFDNETVSGNILTHITDHVPQFLIVKNAIVSYKNLQYYQHDYSKLNADNLIRDFKNCNLAFLNDSTLDLDAKYTKFL